MYKRRSNYTGKLMSVPNRSVADLTYGLLQQNPAWRDMASWRRSQSAVFLDGTVDDRFTYYTNPSVNFDYSVGDAGVWTVPFLHGLDFMPIVEGSFLWAGDGPERRMMPYTKYSPGSPGVYGTEAYYVAVARSDETYIYVDFAVLNDDGYNALNNNLTKPFIFKFNCRRDDAP